MQRLLKKFHTDAPGAAPGHDPGEGEGARRRHLLRLLLGGDARGAGGVEAQGVHLDAMRIRASPSTDDIAAFIAAHDRVFVVEQNRDAQLRTLLINEEEIDPAK